MKKGGVNEMSSPSGKIIVSLGGNALVRRSDTGTIEEQFRNAEAACACLARLASGGTPVIITHGNGPVVGHLVIQNEAAKNTVPPMPLYICDADSEGAVGFIIQQTIYNQLHKKHDIKDVVTIVTQVVVDPHDDAFKNPTKPIGPYYTKEEAATLAREKGWAMAEDSHRGYRRVVPSPKPKRVVEASVIDRLANDGVIVIAAGGGGVPVAELPDGTLKGVDAVIDKDLATSLLAREVGATTFINLTQIDKVYTGFNTANRKGIDDMTVKEARIYMEAGEFAPGSMGPKIRAAIEFLESGGQEVIITSPELIELALEGKAGTRIHR